MRLVLAAFVIKHFENLEASDVTLLQSLEFHVPTFATGELVASGSMEKPPGSRPLQIFYPVVFEIFAGSARVTSALRTQGWTCCDGVDKTESAAGTREGQEAPLRGPKIEIGSELIRMLATQTRSS